MDNRFLYHLTFTFFKFTLKNFIFLKIVSLSIFPLHYITITSWNFINYLSLLMDLNLIMNNLVFNKNFNLLCACLEHIITKLLLFFHSLTRKGTI